MTVRDLLRHTAGLAYPEFGNSAVRRLHAERIVFQRDKTLADFVASLGKLPLARQPGEIWEYSLAADVLARIVEVASGERFDRFLGSRIFNFWIDLGAKLVVVNMIQVAPAKIDPYGPALAYLSYAALTVPEPEPTTSAEPGVAVGAETLASYAGTCEFGGSVSACDRQMPILLYYGDYIMALPA